VTERQMKLKGAIYILALGILLLVSISPAVPARAESATLPGSFSVPLIISNVSASGIGVSYATITWETNGNATSQVFYDTQMHASIDDYAHQQGDVSNLVTRHSIYLTGLIQYSNYHYRTKSVARIDSIELIAISQDYTFRTSMNYVGGGNGSGDATIKTLKLEEAAGITESNIRIDSAGIAQTGGQITTVDGKLSIQVNAGTRLLDGAGQPLTLLLITVPPSSSIPSSLPNAFVLIYDISPSGATFVPPITLIMYYDPARLPPGVSESTLYMAYWNGSEWRSLPGTVDTRRKTISALLSHFSLFALMGKLAPTPTSTPTPESTSTPALTPAVTPTPPAAPTSTQASTPTPSYTLTPLPTPTITPVLSPSPELAGLLNRWWWVLILCLVAIIVVVLSVWWVFKRRKH
jgi:hypothetical protein